MKLTADNSHRAQTIRIASMFFQKKLNTNQIGKRLGMAEAEVWNRMDLVREMWFHDIYDAALSAP